MWRKPKLIGTCEQRRQLTSANKSYLWRRAACVLECGDWRITNAERRWWTSDERCKVQYCVDCANGQRLFGRRKLYNGAKLPWYDRFSCRTFTELPQPRPSHPMSWIADVSRCRGRGGVARVRRAREFG